MTASSLRQQQNKMFAIHDERARLEEAYRFQRIVAFARKGIRLYCHGYLRESCKVLVHSLRLTLTAVKLDVLQSVVSEKSLKHGYCKGCEKRPQSIKSSHFGSHFRDFTRYRKADVRLSAWIMLYVSEIYKAFGRFDTSAKLFTLSFTLLDGYQITGRARAHAIESMTEMREQISVDGLWQPPESTQKLNE